MFDNEYDILTPEEVLEYLNIGKNSVYSLLNSCELKGFRIGVTGRYRAKCWTHM